MENLKIKVANEAESKEAQDLFFELGYGFEGCNIKEVQQTEYVGEFYLFGYGDDCDLTHSCDFDLFTNKPHKEITLPELRAMVNPMKEYLVKTKEGEYHYINDSYDTCPTYVEKIEIPEGADEFKANWRFYKDSDYFFSTSTMVWTRSTLKKDTYATLWKRATHPEELPFIDDEPKSLAEIEQVRQHQHYFKDVSNLDEIDVYMVLKLFNVTDPCLQHIAKKALCAGHRGHKDFERDLKDILDTAKRAVEINKNY